MRRKHMVIIIFALAIMLLLPGMTAEAKANPKLAAKTKVMKTGRLKG